MTRKSSTAAVIAIGDELTTGQSLDTNSRWLARQLTDLGYAVVEHTTVPDDLDQIARKFEALSRLCSVIIATGGLGPTQDDLSRDALASFLGESLIIDEQAIHQLERLFSARGRALTDANRQQALRPQSASCISNDRGTAPGLAVEHNGTKVFILPGPPHENQPMFKRAVLPGIQLDSGLHAIRVIQHFGIAESAAAMKLGPILDRTRDPLVGITASDGVISCRIRGLSSSNDMDERIEATDRAIGEALGAYRIGTGEQSLAHRVVDEAIQRSVGLRVAESCTGGLLGAAMTSVPGSSAAFQVGWQVYSNTSKTALLSVRESDIEQHGAVSAEVALALAKNAAVHEDFGRSGPVLSLSITGIAGPSGGSEQKPVGTVFVGCALVGEGAPDSVEVRRFLFPGDRDTIRSRAVQSALALALFRMRGINRDEFLWEVPTESE